LIEKYIKIFLFIKNIKSIKKILENKINNKKKKKINLEIVNIKKDEDYLRRIVEQMAGLDMEGLEAQSLTLSTRDEILEKPINISSK
jgi:hypothetical protein